MTCKNCYHTLEGNYCHNCGQKSNVRRIDRKYIFREISTGIFQLDHGFFFTIKELFVRPGHSIRAFLEGKRKPYFKPIAYVFLLSTAYALTSHFFGKNTYLEDFTEGFYSGMTNDGENAPNTFKVLNWLATNHTYTTLVLLPFYAFASYGIFEKSKYNYFEHLVLNAYITGQQTLIYIIFSLLLIKLDDDSFLAVFPFGIAIVYNFWVFAQFFIDKTLDTRLFLTVITYIFYFLFLVMAVIMIGLVGLL